MKIKLDYVFKGLDEKPIKNQGKDFTLRQACENVLGMEKVDPKTRQPIHPINGVEKNRRGGLAFQIHKAGSEIDLSSEDITLLKDLIGETGSPTIVFQAWNILDPRDPKETIPSDKK